MKTFTRTATAVLFATLATAAGAQGYKPLLVGLKPVVSTKPVLISPSNVLVAGPISSRAEADAVRAAARAQAQAVRDAANATRAAARGGR